LPASFYNRATELVARDLLGAVLDHRSAGGRTAGRIVEVEAYLGPDDPACHSAVGLTVRNAVLHGRPGTAYVYFIYGVHWCVNAVTRDVGHGSAVLIRGVEPLVGAELMRSRRGLVADRVLADGPGKLCQAFGIDGSLNGVSLQRGALRILTGDAVPDDMVATGPRIGISKAKDWPLRFRVKNGR
jgi:DNA-3-methyladenine glycosylase